MTSRKRWLFIAAGAAAWAALAAADTPLHHLENFGSRPAFAAATAALMALWWLTEAVSIYATACLPLILFPLTGVFGKGLAHNVLETVLPYADPYIFLFMGGMGIAAAMQQWNLHQRIALHIMRRVGTDPRRLLLGFLCATAFISLWISNTATAAMMLPIGLAIVKKLEAAAGRRLAHYGAAVMLAVAYGANIGGIGTKIGTVPNALFSQFMALRGVEISFFAFSAVGLPFIAGFLPAAWYALWRMGRVDAPGGHAGRETVAAELHKLGPMTRGEWTVLTVFLGTAILWIFGMPIADLLRGITGMVWLKTAHVEGGVAMSAAAALMLIPAGKGQALSLSALKAQPWLTLLLMGGSFAMAEGIQKSGLAEWMGATLRGLSDLAPALQLLAVGFATVGLSAVASNAATLSVMLNVLSGAVAPSFLPTVLFTSTIAASCDFALPAGTPPNAIVFGSGYLTVARMAKTGAVLDAAAALWAAAWCFFAVPWVLG